MRVFASSATTSPRLFVPFPPYQSESRRTSFPKTTPARPMYRPSALFRARSGPDTRRDNTSVSRVHAPTLTDYWGVFVWCADGPQTVHVTATDGVHLGQTDINFSCSVGSRGVGL